MDYKYVKEFTQGGPQRVASLATLTAQLNAYGVPGDLVEFGVWKGGMCMAMARTMLETGPRQLREIHLFDTFAGHCEQDFTDKDIELGPGGRTAFDILADERYKGIPYKEVKANCESTGYPSQLFNYHIGDAAKTVKGYKPQNGIAILRLDMGWYKPTKAVLFDLFTAVNKGGVVIIDDYGVWNGCREAVDEYLAGRQLPRVLCDNECLVLWPT